MSSDLSQIIKDMMTPDYRRRPSAQQLLNHPLIRKIDFSRRWRLKVERSLMYAKSLFNWFLKIFILICYPFKYLSKKLTNSLNIETNESHSPLKTIKTNHFFQNDFDSNYSDDDLFDTSSHSAFNTSKISDLSSNSDDRLSIFDNTFDNK